MCLNKKKKDFPDFLKINNLDTSNKEEISELFNKFFATIGPNLAAKLNPSGLPSMSSYLTEDITHRFTFAAVASKDIIKTITKAAPKTSSGPDTLSMKLIKLISDEISYPLTMIVNQSLITGTVPQKMKVAKVIPLF